MIPKIVKKLLHFADRTRQPEMRYTSAQWPWESYAQWDARHELGYEIHLDTYGLYI